MNTDRDRLPAALALALAARGHASLSDAQHAVLDPAADGRDLVLSARTGSGKTVAFGLALAPVLLGGEGGRAPRALVVAPTRELARQAAGELGWLYGQTAVRIALCAGGADPRAERRALRAGCDLAIGSPGRLRDHLARGALDLSRIEAVVIDEADDMLDLGFRAELDALLQATPEGRRTLMVSATIGPKVLALAAAYQRDPLRLEVAGAPVDLRFEAVCVAPAEREGAVANLLRLHEAPGAIVFCARREEVAALAERLGARGFRVVALSGALPQRERDAALAAMRSGQARVCVATDLAARGLDLPGLELVVHADPPANPAALTHRSGRAGRAGQSGRAVLVVPHRLRGRMQALADRAGVALDWTPVPGSEAIFARDEARLVAALTGAAAPEAQERAAAARLLAAHDAERLAVALLRLHRPAARPVELGALSAPETAARAGRRSPPRRR
jgi:ATP-dependent RNA helicase DeaD